MVQTLELDNFIQDYFRETITNFLAVHSGEWFFSFANNEPWETKIKEVNKFLRN